MEFIKDENGQGMLEYVLIIALVALVVIGVIIATKRVSSKAGSSANDKISQADEALGGIDTATGVIDDE